MNVLSFGDKAARSLALAVLKKSAESVEKILLLLRRISCAILR